VKLRIIRLMESIILCKVEGRLSHNKEKANLELCIIF